MELYYFGPEGTFTHQAAMEFSKLLEQENADLKPAATIVDALHAVREAMLTGRQVCACIPLENSIQGSVTASWDSLGHKSPMDLPQPQIVSALRLPIQQNLLVKEKTVALSEISTVYSHPQALAQCRAWLRENLPQATVVSSESTARAAQSVARSADECIAAIGALAAARHYNLYVRNESIEDDKNNTTRFGLIADPTWLATERLRPHREGSATLDATRTVSLLLTNVENAPGGLAKVLQPFSENQFNLNRIESRPVGTLLGIYVFYLDVEWDLSCRQENWESVRQSLRDLNVDVKVLGYFPEW